MTPYRAFFALFLALAALFGQVVTATPAQAATCTNVWLTNPSYFENFPSGTKRCIWPGDRANGWVRIHRLDNKSLKTIDWVQYGYGYTTTPPNNGKYQPNADLVRALAKKHNVRLQFAYKSRDAVGCTGEWAGQVNGTYYVSPRAPGQGLIRLGTGYYSTCMRNRTEALDTARHEIAHALLERHCPDHFEDPRFENITDAYARKYLGLSTRGNYGFTWRDLRKAVAFHDGRC